MMHATAEQRLATFEGKDNIFPIDIKRLAEAGFCWTPFTASPATVRCEDCELILKDIPRQTDPIIAHERARPNCPFIKSVLIIKLPDITKAAVIIKLPDATKPSAVIKTPIVINAPIAAKSSAVAESSVIAKTPTVVKASDSVKTPDVEVPAVIKAPLIELDTVEDPDVTKVPHLVKAPHLIKALGVIKPAASVVQAPHVDNVLIDISDSEPENIASIQEPCLEQKTAHVPSDTIKDLMEVFTAIPSKTVNDIVGVLTNRTIGDKLAGLMEKTASNATTRPIPDDLKTCRHCRAVFEQRDELFRHIYTNCGKNPDACPNPFPCRVCRLSFDTKKRLKKHLEDIHNISLWF